MGLLRARCCFLAGSCVLLMGMVGDGFASPLSSSVKNVKGAQSQMASHRAIYDVSMLSSKNGSQVLGIQGKMLFSLKKSCEGWITNHQFSMIYDYSESPAVRIETKFSSFESFDGKRLRFSSVRSRNGEIYEEIRGQADVGSPHFEKNNVQYSLPEPKKIDLTVGTLFPMSHAYHLLQAAENGQKIYFSSVFDGSDGEGAVDINAVIGHKVSVGHFDREKDISKIDPDLINVGSYPMQMAVFPSDKQESLADYELSMDVLENGIVRKMIVDYHDFSVAQKLVALEKVPSEDCGE